jgi:hypothetical protein
MNRAAYLEETIKKIRPLSTQEPKMYKRISEEFGRLEIEVRRRGSSSRASNENISSYSLR